MKRCIPIFLCMVFVSTIIICGFKSITNPQVEIEATNFYQKDSLEKYDNKRGGEGINADIVKSEQKISAIAGNFQGQLDFRDIFGCSVAGIGDLDADGINDIAVGASGDDDGGSSKGAVWILFLNRDGTVKSHQKISDTEGNFNGVLADDDFSWSVSNIGDLDGDNITDIVVGAPWDDNGGHDNGAVWILFLNRNGTVKNEQKISDTAGNFSGSLSGDYFGTSVSGIGDLNDDGIKDIVVGAPEDDDGGVNRGAVWILFLNSNGTVKNHQKICDINGNFSGILDDRDMFGRSVSSIGDLNGDGINDIIVSALNDDDGGTDWGAVWVLFLNSNGTVKNHQKISDTAGNFHGDLNGSTHFGYSVSNIGDLNEDNITEIAISRCIDNDGGANRGAIWVLFLEKNGTVKFHQKISDIWGGFGGIIHNGDYFGNSVTNIGDLDGDGKPDIVVGAYQNDDGGDRKGSVWVLFLCNDIPSFNSLGNGPLITGELAIFTANITDKIEGVDEVWFNYSINNNSAYNYSSKNQTNNSWSIIISIPVWAKSIEFYFWANDTFNNASKSNKKTIAVIDNRCPTLNADFSPRTGTTGDHYQFNISANDNVEINSVYINWTHGELGGNESLNLSNGYWIRPIQVGHNLDGLSYIIYINDMYNNYAVSSQKSVYICDNDDPYLIGDHSQQRGTTGDSFQFNVSVFDNIEVANVKINWAHGRFYNNISLENEGDYWTGSIILDHDVGFLAYFIIIKDTSNNHNVSDLLTIEVNDNDEPEFLSEKINANPTTGDLFTFEVSVKDNIDIYAVSLVYAFDDGKMFKVNMILNGINYTSEIEIPDNATIVNYSFNMSDKTGNWHNESRPLKHIIDNDKPRFSDLTTGMATTGEKYDILINATDNLGVGSVYIQYSFNNGILTNESMLNVDGNNWNLTIIIPYNATYFQYSFFIEDTIGNLLVSNIFTHNIVDNDDPQANAGLDVYLDQHENVTFNGINSSDNIAIHNYIWTFLYNNGTKQILHGKTVNFTFNHAGKYNVTLNVTDAVGNWDMDCLAVTVRDITPPIAEAGDDQSINQYQVVTFNASSSSDNIGINKFTWSFQHGNVEYILYGLETNFSFTLAGIYNVSLNISDVVGNWHTDCLTVTVRDITPPIAKAGDNITLNQGETLTFNGSSSEDNVGIENYSWSFKYGEKSVILVGIEADYIFNLAGKYFVTLVVSDAEGNLGTLNFTVTVNDITPPKAIANASEEVSLGEKVVLDASKSTDNVVLEDYIWSFIYEGTVVELRNVTSIFHFHIPGNFNISLTVIDSSKNSNKTHILINVIDTEKPIASFTGKTEDIFVGDVVTYNGSCCTDNVRVDNWTWNISGPNTDITFYGPKIYFEFPQVGRFTIFLTINDAQGNNATAIKKVIVKSNEESSDSTSSKTELGMICWILPLVIIVIGSIIFVFFRLKKRSEEKKKKEVKDEVIEKGEEVEYSDPSQKEVDIENAELDEFPKKQKVSTEESEALTDEKITSAPFCPNCNEQSHYYPEYDCYWCDECQEYVFSKKEKEYVTSLESSTSLNEKETLVTPVVDPSLLSPIMESTDSIELNAEKPQIEYERHKEEVVRKYQQTKHILAKTPSFIDVTTAEEILERAQKELDNDELYKAINSIQESKDMVQEIRSKYEKLMDRLHLIQNKVKETEIQDINVSNIRELLVKGRKVLMRGDFSLCEEYFENALKAIENKEIKNIHDRHPQELSDGPKTRRNVLIRYEKENDIMLNVSDSTRKNNNIIENKISKKQSENLKVREVPKEKTTDRTKLEKTEVNKNSLDNVLEELDFLFE